MLRQTTAILLTLMVAATAAAANPLFDELLTQGVLVDSGQRIRLPAPSLTDGLNAAQQQAALTEIVDDRYPVAEFARDVVVAPFVLKFRDAGGEANAARGVDLWFVVHGNLDDLASADVFEEFSTARGTGTTIHELTAEELASRGLNKKIAADERFVHTAVTILDRVELSQTSRCMLTRTAESVLVASQVDDRFADDDAFPNVFRPLTRSDQGDLTKGSPQPYTGAGGYLKATRLLERQGAILVEYHLVYLEPQQWFNGANLLRSKLPVFLQSRVRALRRDLREPSK